MHIEVRAVSSEVLLIIFHSINDDSNVDSADDFDSDRDGICIPTCCLSKITFPYYQYY